MTLQCLSERISEGVSVDYKQLEKDRTNYSLVHGTEPTGYVRVLRNVWCWCCKGDGSQIVTYRKYSFLCNEHKQIAESFASRVHRIYPAAKVVFMERVFCPVNSDDYYLN